jgi:hypothetical protein
MEIIIKFYNSFDDLLPKEQIEYYNDLTINENLTSYSYCDLKTPIID